MSQNNISRRNFLPYAGLTGTAFLVGLSSSSARLGKSEIVSGLPIDSLQFTPYIRIDPAGGITIFNTKPEMGQGTFQSIPALICEELEVSLDQVTIKQSNGEKALGKAQRAGGSASIRTSYIELRKVGAAAKEMLVKAASNKWGVDVARCYAEKGKVIHGPTKRTFTYGELAQEASMLDIPKEPKLKDRKDFKVLGKPVKRPDIPLKVTGKAVFGIDVQLPGMVYASVERCAVLGGTLRSFDATEALSYPGVEKVVEVSGVVGKYNFVGVAVIANSYWAAVQARKKLKTEWDNKGFETFNSADYETQLRNLASEEGLPDKNIGSVDTVNLLPENRIEAFYETPVVAHHTMEPINCVAEVKGDKLEVWASTQVPSTITGSGPDDLHKHTGFFPDNITLHTQFIGGGLGRRLYIDFNIEAVNVAKQIDKPVKVIWSREDTTQFGPFRPMTFSALRGGFSDDGKLITFQHKVISPSYFDSINAQFDKTKVDPIMVEGIGEQAYEIPNLKTSYVQTDYHVPVAAWRSVTSSTLVFSHECFIDELAHKALRIPWHFGWLCSPKTLMQSGCY